MNTIPCIDQKLQTRLMFTYIRTIEQTETQTDGHTQNNMPIFTIFRFERRALNDDTCNLRQSMPASYHILLRLEKLPKTEIWLQLPHGQIILLGKCQHTSTKK